MTGKFNLFYAKFNFMYAITFLSPNPLDCIARTTRCLLTSYFFFIREKMIAQAYTSSDKINSRALSVFFYSPKSTQFQFGYCP